MTISQIVVLVVIIILLIVVAVTVYRNLREVPQSAFRPRRDQKSWRQEKTKNEDRRMNSSEIDLRTSLPQEDKVYDVDFFKMVASSHSDQVPRQEITMSGHDHLKTMIRSHPKPATVPTFARFQAHADNNSQNYGFEVHTHKSKVNLPKNFSAVKEWSGMITGVYDQERCGSCWAFATTSALTDRFRIASQGTVLKDGDYLSPFHLAACMKCGVDNACPKVCEGNYLDDVLQYLVDHGAVAQSDIEAKSTQGEEYRCFNWHANGVKSWKGTEKYRVNLYPPSMLITKKHLAENEQAIMEEIYKNGPVCTIFRVYVPLDHRNFYLYKEGIYGAGWKSEPKETEGYHAIDIMGWGEEVIDGQIVKYWIIRNSWGDSFGTQGLGRILRGENFGLIEADVWAITPDLTGH